MNFKIFIILSVFNISSIACNKNKSGAVVITKESEIVDEYEKTTFELFRNPLTLFWKWKLEPVCAYFRVTIKKICTRVIHKLQNAGLKINELDENSENFSYGCYPFKLNGVKHNPDGSPRIQRTNRCPYTLQSGKNLFISQCFTISNSYFVYAADKISKKTKLNKVNNAHLEEASLVGLATAGPKYVWFFS